MLVFKVKTKLIALSVLGMMLAQFPAMANFTEIHKSTDATTGKTKVYIPGVASGTETEIISKGGAKDKILTLNNCGWGKFSDSTTSPIVEITSSTGEELDPINGIEVASAPTCTAGTTPGTYVDSNASDAIGRTIKAGTTFWVKGGNGVGSFAIKTRANNTIKLKGGNCGWASVAVSATRPLTSFIKDGNTKVLADLPSTNTPMYCKKTGTTYTNYLPAAGF